MKNLQSEMSVSIRRRRGRRAQISQFAAGCSFVVSGARQLNGSKVDLFISPFCGKKDFVFIFLYNSSLLN